MPSGSISARRAPSAEKARRDAPPPAIGLRTVFSSKVAVSHKDTPPPSLPPVANVLPSGEKARQHHLSDLTWASFLPVVPSQSWMFSLESDHPNILPSGEKAKHRIVWFPFTVKRSFAVAVS